MELNMVSWLLKHLLPLEETEEALQTKKERMP